MGSMQEIMQLCRLCLMKDQVNTPIFENVDDISQVFIRISACLPIKVSREDALPKNICENCSYKLEIFYELLNTSVASEKQLLAWAKQLGVDRLPKVISTCSLSTTHVRPLVMKQEVSELLDPHSIDDLDASDDLDLTNQTQDYNISQQQLSYETVGFEFQPDQFIDNQTTTDIASKSTPKRKRSAIGLNIDLDSEDDAGLCSSKSAKTDGIHNGESDADDTAFDDLPSTSGENDQPGPSGIGKPSDSSFLPHNSIEEVMLNVKTELATNNAGIKLKTNRKQQQPSKFLNTEIKLEKNSDNDEELKDYLEDCNYLCHICQNNQKYSEAGLRTHFRVEHKGRRLKKLHCSEEIVQCDVCSKQFNSMKSLKGHITSHINQVIICDTCNSHFKNLLSYTIHLRQHSQEDEFKCILCDFNTDSVNNITEHINKLHKEIYEYYCEQCGKGFHIFALYEEHANVHTGETPFECDECGKHFPYSQYLTAHRKSAHKKINAYKSIPHECVLCKKQYKHRKSLTLHMNVHTGRVEICDICGKSLSSREKLKFHLRTHTGFKPFSCNVCGKCFTTKPILIEHERIHTGEKPYCCKFCPKGFSQRSSLVIHMRGHTGEKPYACHICEKGFVARAMLNVHVKRCRGFM